jgi:transglutaminase-like putative cysteine protease
VRQFRFTYAGTINQLEPGAAARLWLPLAHDTFEQRVEVGKIALPAEHRLTRDAKGNRFVYFEAAASERGEIPFSVEYVVVRRELVRGEYEPVEEDELARLAAEAKPAAPEGGYLRRLLAKDGSGLSQAPKLLVAQQIYDAVDAQMRYDKPPGAPWGRGDALWACQAGYGNCTDFHSLFSAAAREAEIPVRFEMGFPLPTQRGRGEIPGYHCWAKFASAGRWIPVDISEADKHPELKQYYFGNLTADRFMFTVGRGLQLDPPQEAGPVNYLIYPYAEVKGKPHTSFTGAFRFEDLP